MKKTALFLSMLAAAVLLPTTNALADTINVSFTSPIQTGAAGDTLTFEATVSVPDSKGGTIFLNGDTVNIAGASADDTPFLTGFPFTMEPNDTFTGDAFTVTLPGNIAPGIYIGSWTIVGGDDASSLDTLGQANFEIDVPSSVPEPGTWMLFGTGLGALALAVYGHRGAFQN